MLLIKSTGWLLLSLALRCSAPGSAAGETTLEGAFVQEPPASTIEWSDDPDVARARAAMQEGRPWHASRTLAPLLADPRRRTPEVVLLSALAAAEWEGWSQVENLLSREPWVDSQFDGMARLLLTRAALARNSDEAATAHAEASLTSARSSAHQAERLVLLARALDRRRLADSAAATYARAADLLNDGADWLRLRAAAIHRDPAARADLLSRVRTDVARDRVTFTEAVARERAGDRAGAIQAYEEMGARVSALRLRLLEPDADRHAIRSALMTIVANEPGSVNARTAVEVLDASFAPLTPQEELAVARALVRAGPFARAAQGYSRAAAAGLASPVDRLAHGRVLIRLGRTSEADAVFARLTAPAPVAAAARYDRARAMVRAGRTGEGRTILRAILRDFPNDTSAASALMLLGDLAVDEGRDGPARDAFRDLASRFPRHRFAAPARFRAAMIAQVSGQTRVAVLELDSIIALEPRGSESLSAGYWSGRLWAQLGDSARARAKWREVVAKEPLSFYAAASARRLGEQPWAPPSAADSFARFDEIEAAMRRAALLERLGMDMEARLEYDRLESDADASVERLLATANAFRERGLASRGIQLARRAQARGVTGDSRLYRLLYPVVHRDVLVAEASGLQLDPALVAGLIRQESHFNPRATSPAGARGLMQVMPSVGQQLARRLGFPYWDAALLYQPDVSMQLGTRHLADAMRRYQAIEHVLAAYNAGGSRVSRWTSRAGTNDPEMFVERIPFVETRDYVRIVQRNQELYRALYEW